MELSSDTYVPHINQSRVVQILTGLQNDIIIGTKAQNHWYKKDGELGSDITEFKRAGRVIGFPYQLVMRSIEFPKFTQKTLFDNFVWKTF